MKKIRKLNLNKISIVSLRNANAIYGGDTLFCDTHGCTHGCDPQSTMPGCYTYSTGPTVSDGNRTFSEAPPPPPPPVPSQAPNECQINDI